MLATRLPSPSVVIPLETGDLYHEDKERFEQALAAFDRILKRWVKAGG